jgi:cytochrome c oxidase cbb3-type subunit 3
MSEESDEIVKGHEYDGIREFDNPLPAWWLASFFITIIFGFLYWLHYSFGGAPTQRQELQASLAAIQERQKSAGGAAESDADFEKLKSPERLARGKAVFAEKCAVCHGPDLQGLIGPNLTDDYWIHGRGTPADIAQIVRAGVTDKGMPSWEQQLPKEDIQSLALFVAGQHGSQPPNPKAPQGERIGKN